MKMNLKEQIVIALVSLKVPMEQYQIVWGILIFFGIQFKKYWITKHKLASYTFTLFTF